MKYLFILFTIFTVLSCSKSEPKVEDKTKTVKVDMVFDVGTFNNQGGYRVNGKEKSGFSNINQSKTLNETLKVGDEITLFLNRYTTNGHGDFRLTLYLNGKFIKQADGGSSLNIELTHKITEEDTKQ